MANETGAPEAVAQDAVANEAGQGDAGTTAGTPGAAATGGDEAATGPGPLGEAERAERLAQLQGLIELMRPSVQADGGDLVLVAADVEAGVVEVQLQGACSSCAVSSATLQGGVERILTSRLPWVREVVGGLDESLDPFESESLGQGGYVPRY